MKFCATMCRLCVVEGEETDLEMGWNSGAPRMAAEKKRRETEEVSLRESGENRFISKQFSNASVGSFVFKK